MGNPFLKRLFHNICKQDCMETFVKKQEESERFIYGILYRFYSQQKKPNKVEEDVVKQEKNAPQVSLRSKVEKKVDKYTSDEEDLFGDNKWKLELAWLTKALEPALQLCRWALPTGSEIGNRSPPGTRSVSEIISSIQRSKSGIQDWTLSDLTVGLYLLYLRQASSSPIEDVKGIQISSDSIVHDLIYHTELAKGAYKDNAASLARHSMLRESNVLKFVKNSSVMRPGYYIGVDTHKKLVIFGIRGTHTVYDLITDIVSSSDGEVTVEGYSTHFGTAEAARWLLHHEMETIRKCLVKYEGFRLRLVGHSLGGATASLLAIMLRKKSLKELGFSPDIVTAIGYATPPCVSKELAESCSDFVTTVVMQDDIIPRLSVASLTRLRDEILDTDWMSVVEKEDWRSFIDLVTNAKQVVSSMQDVARKLADYAKFRKTENSSDNLVAGKQSSASPRAALTTKTGYETSVAVKTGGSACTVPEELFVPGSVYYLKRNLSSHSGSPREFFTLWKRNPGEHFQRIVLSSNIISDHKCDSHYYALRDVLKGLPGPYDEGIFR
ncbi:Fungal lipase-like domain containing protein [Parasponia andersonii]|uniref:Fungal lipase-like domain containing protein n=1 Tax=Parasponia andersonii TaxID=3476 RepID=A0A2P5CNI1_PARAD|nr:Fungal lipase-like domain containing protein [Parasponia andersonii]